MLLHMAFAVAVLGQSPESPSSADVTTRLWQSYLKPSGAASSPDAILIEGMPVIGAAEGFDPSLAAVASLVDYQLADRLPSRGEYLLAPNPIDGFMEHAKRQSMDEKELSQLASALREGLIQKDLNDAFSEYRSAVAKAAAFRTANLSIIPTSGQARMALLRELLGPERPADVLTKTVHEFNRIRHLRCTIHDVRGPTFDAIWRHLQQGTPGVLVSKNGHVWVVVGAIRDAGADYLVCADPAKVEPSAVRGEGLVSPRDLQSKDPDVRAYVNAQKRTAVYRDFVVRRTPSVPPGVQVVPFTALGDARWFAVSSWQSDTDSIGDAKQKVDHEIARIRGKRQ